MRCSLNIGDFFSATKEHRRNLDNQFSCPTNWGYVRQNIHAFSHFLPLNDVISAVICFHTKKKSV